MKKTEALSIRVEPKLMKALKREAAKQQRSLAQLCHLLLEKALDGKAV